MSLSTHGLASGQIVAALDIGSSKIVCLIAVLTGSPEDPLSLANARVIGIGYQRSAGIKNGMVFEPAKAETAIRAAVDKAERQAGLSVDNLYVALNAGRLQSHNFGVDAELGDVPVRPRDVQQLLQEGWRQVADSPRAILHAIPLGFTLDDTSGIDEPVGYKASQLSVDFLSVTADMDPVRRMLGCIEDSYLTPVSVVAAPYATALAVARPEEASKGCLVIDLGGGASSVAVMAGRRFIYADSLARGGQQITSALAKRFQIEPREAEQLKLLLSRRTDSDTTHPQVSAMVNRQLSEMFIQLKERLARTGFALEIAQYVVLAGGGALYHDAPRLAAEIFGKPARRGAPRGANGLPRQLVSPAYAALWGTMLYQEKRHLELSQMPGVGQTGGEGTIRRLGQWLQHLSSG